MAIKLPFWKQDCEVLEERHQKRPGWLLFGDHDINAVATPLLLDSCPVPTRLKAPYKHYIRAGKVGQRLDVGTFL